MAAEREYRVVVTEGASKSMQNIIEYLMEQGAHAAARNVYRELLSLTRKLNKLPRRFPREKYLRNSNGEFRVVTRWSYKIIYEIVGQNVYIIDYFHTSQNPNKIRQQDSS